MKTTVLGHGGAFDKFGTSFLVNNTILVDCSSECIKSLFNAGAESVRLLLITHIHSDHINGFEQFIYYLRYVTKTEHLLKVIAPVEFLKLLKHMPSCRNGYAFHITTAPEYKSNINSSPARMATAGDSSSLGVRVGAIPVQHDNLEAYAYELHDGVESVVFTGDIDTPFIVPTHRQSCIKYLFHDVGWTGLPERKNRVHCTVGEVITAYNSSPFLNKIIGVHMNQNLPVDFADLSYIVSGVNHYFKIAQQVTYY